MPFLLVARPRPHVTLVTLNRPERMNAMSFDLMIRARKDGRRPVYRRPPPGVPGRHPAEERVTGPGGSVLE